MTLRTLHLTMSSMSSQTERGIFLRPTLASIGERGSRRLAAEGANQTSRSFSGPSKGVERWRVFLSSTAIDGLVRGMLSRREVVGAAEGCCSMHQTDTF